MPILLSRSPREPSPRRSRTTTWSRNSAVPGVRFEKRPRVRQTASIVAGPLQRLDHPRQPEPVQFLHDRDGQGRDPRLPRRVSAARDVVAVVFTGARRQGVLHRRQHQGVRRVLRRQSAGVPAVHAALQRHGLVHPRAATSRSSAASTACASAAGRRSAWPATSRSRRIWRASARPAPSTDRRRHRRRDRLPARHRRRRARDGSLGTLCEPWSAHKAYRHGACSTTSSRRSRSTASSSPIPLVVTDRYARRLRPRRPRRAQDGRGARGGQDRSWRAAPSISRCSTRRWSSSAPSSC